jgi:hypothetical protein
MNLTKGIQRVLAIPVLALAACVTKSNPSESTQILYVWGVASYSSASKSVSACDQSQPAELPSAALNNIAKIAERSGFFSLPERSPQPPIVVLDDNGVERTLTLINSCSENSLEISFHGKRHEVVWSCGVDFSTRPEMVALNDALEPYFDKLPKCVRY